MRHRDRKLTGVLRCRPPLQPMLLIFLFPMRLSSVSYVLFKYHPLHRPADCLCLAAVLTMLSNLGSDFQTEILPVIYVFDWFWIVQIIDNNLSQPIIFSKSVSSHPLEIFLVILIAGFCFWYLRDCCSSSLTILKV
jgi:hypothetical protein